MKKIIEEYWEVVLGIVFGVISTLFEKIFENMNKTKSFIIITGILIVLGIILYYVTTRVMVFTKNESFKKTFMAGLIVYYIVALTRFWQDTFLFGMILIIVFFSAIISLKQMHKAINDKKL